MERYEIVKELGSGNFGVAKLAREKWSGELYAIKYIERGQKVLSTCLLFRNIYWIQVGWFIWMKVRAAYIVPSPALRTGYIEYVQLVGWFIYICEGDFLVFADWWACAEGDHEPQIIETSQYN